MGTFSSGMWINDHQASRPATSCWFRLARVIGWAGLWAYCVDAEIEAETSSGLCAVVFAQRSEVSRDDRCASLLVGPKVGDFDQVQRV